LKTTLASPTYELLYGVSHMIPTIIYVREREVTVIENISNFFYG
jgi:hypothetical protein